jgi:hypothetical protein
MKIESKQFRVREAHDVNRASTLGAAATDISTARPTIPPGTQAHRLRKPKERIVVARK